MVFSTYETFIFVPYQGRAVWYIYGRNWCTTHLERLFHSTVKLSSTYVHYVLDMPIVKYNGREGVPSNDKNDIFTL